ncbi:MAG: hypothetical protein AAGE84_12255 [Cyanobacteria bacterium P01_G01_bin.39]
MANSYFTAVTGIVKPGHQVASGNAPNSPYERGTLEMQLPFFRNLGLDLTGLFLGTLNISIAPYTFKLIQPQYTFPLVKWHPNYAAETFSFSPCKVFYLDKSYEGLIYYPHPETKIGHFQDDSIIEVVAPKISQLNYGDRLKLEINPQKVKLISRN